MRKKHISEKQKNFQEGMRAGFLDYSFFNSNASAMRNAYGSKKISKQRDDRNGVSFSKGYLKGLKKAMKKKKR